MIVRWKKCICVGEVVLIITLSYLLLMATMMLTTYRLFPVDLIRRCRWSDPFDLIFAGGHDDSDAQPESHHLELE